MEKLEDLISNLEQFKELKTVPIDQLLIDLSLIKEEFKQQLSIHGVMCSFIDELKFNLNDLTKDRDYWLEQKQYEKAISILTCIEQIKQVVEIYNKL